MDDIIDTTEVLVSFTTAWLCTIASCRELLPASAFVKIPFGRGTVDSMRAPDKGDKNDKVSERHRQLYSWLAHKASDELKDDQEKCVVLWITDGHEETEEIGAIQLVYGVYVIECVKTDCFQQSNKLIREGTHSILKAVQVCGLSDGDLPYEFAVDLKVWKARDGLRYVAELGTKKQRVEHGTFRVGHWEIRSWMLHCEGK